MSDDEITTKGPRVVVLARAGVNYVEWLESIRDLLAIKRLLPYVKYDAEGEPAKQRPVLPEKGDITEKMMEAVEDYDLKCAQALGYIRPSLGVNKRSIQGIDHPAKALNKIREIHSQTTKFDIQILIDEFVNLRPFGDDFEGYMAKLDTVVEGLEANGIHRGDVELMNQWFVSLLSYPEGHPYHKVGEFTQANMNLGLDVKKEAVERMILAAYRGITNKEIAETEEEKAFQAMAAKFGYAKIGTGTGTGTGGIAGVGRRTFSDGVDTRTCRCCGQKGHLARDCPRAEPNGCHSCGKSGHRAPTCPHPEAVAFRQRAYGGGGSGPGFRGGERAAAAVSSFDAAMQSMTLYKRQPDQALNMTEKAYTLATKKMTTLIDSGCSRHMFGMKRFFDLSPNYRRMTAPVMVGNGQVIYAEGMGDIFLMIEVGGKTAELHLANCLYVPQLSSNLISISQLDKAGSDIMFTEGKAILKRNNKMTLIGKMLDTNLYEVNAKPPTLPKLESANMASTSASGNIWHQRLGHLGGNSLRNLKDSVDGLTQTTVPHQCKSCILGKMTRARFPDSSSRSTEPLQLITFDLAGPFDDAIGGAKYFMIMVDDYSKYYHVELLRTKSEATRWLKQVLIQWENQLSRSVKVLRSDGGGEFDNRAISQFCEEKGIRAQMTTARTPEQNGAAERAVRTIKEGTRTLLIDSGLSNKYWGAAAKNFAYVRNRTRTATTGDKTPIELFTGKRPSVSHLRVFGCVAYMHIPKEDRIGQTWKPKAKRCIFLGYGDDELKAKKAWTLFDPYILKKHVTIHVKFCEDQRWADRKVSVPKGDIFFQDISPAIGEAGSRVDEAESETLEAQQEVGEAQPEIGEAKQEIGEAEAGPPEIGTGEDQHIRTDDDHKIDEDRSLTPPMPSPPSRIPTPVGQPDGRKKGTGIWKNYEYVPVPAQGSLIPQILPDGSRRSRQPPQRFRDRAAIAHEPKLEDILDQVFLTLAEMDPADPVYLDAKLDEMASMAKNEVWTLVPRQTGQPKPISVRWVCTMKDLPDGTQKPKARLVARGYTQKAGIDYQEIFAPVVKLESIRYIIARACQRQMVLSQGDVKTAFLSSSMEGETIYIE